MNTTQALFNPYRNQSVFLVWGSPDQGPRSRVFAKELGIEQLYYLSSTSTRGPWTAPFKYTLQALQTVRLLFTKRPQLVFVQSPPSFAVWFAYLYSMISGNSFIVDAHSGAFQHPLWVHPEWAYRLLSRKALVTIVTNEHFQKKIERWGGRAMVLRDIPTVFPGAQPPSLGDQFKVAMISSFAPDEPLENVFQAARRLPDVQFFITGKKNRVSPKTLALAPENVLLTDYLPDERYYALLKSCHAVMSLTDRDHTMQRGACEALSLGKPIITSNWPILREYFHMGTIHVENTVDGIYQGVKDMMADHQRHQSDILALRAEQQREWQEKIKVLVSLVAAKTNRGAM